MPGTEQGAHPVSVEALALRSDAPGRHRAGFELLGVPLRIECETDADLLAACEACAQWQRIPVAVLPRLTIRLRNSGGRAAIASPGFTVTGPTLRIGGEGAEGIASALDRTARCTISQTYFDEPEVLRSHVLEPLTLFVLTRNGRVPVHASAIRVGDLGILFAGPSGAGKSSLAFAADEAGLTVVSEDTVYAQLEPRLAVWGWRSPVHLLPEAAGRRPGPLRIRNGRAKRAIAITHAAAHDEPVLAAVLCILQHGARASLERLAPEHATRLLPPLDAGFDLLAPAIKEVEHRLVANGAWLLTLSRSPADAIGLVTVNLDRLRGSAATR